MKASLLSRLGLCSLIAALVLSFFPSLRVSPETRVPVQAFSYILRCQRLAGNSTITSSASFARRDSDRYVPGTRPVLIKRARIWTGERNGSQVIRGDILMEKGLIKSIGRISDVTLASYKTDLIIIDANNSWVTPGLVDIHSQLGIRATPYLQGASDDWCSNNGNIQVHSSAIDIHQRGLLSWDFNL